jgi:hypothetical protein
MIGIEGAGGEGGIRTPGTLSGTPVFKTGAINHSATSPGNSNLAKRVADAWLVYNRFGQISVR